MGKKHRNEAISISARYAIFGILWILLSDKLLDYILPDIEKYKNFQTYKGWFYILITTLMVYDMIRRRMRMQINEMKKTTEAYEKLQSTHEELVKLEAELQNQKNLTESIILDAPIFIITHDESKIISFNPYAKKITGYLEEDFREKSWMELMVPEEYWSDIESCFIKIREGNLVQSYEFPIITKDGSLINILWNCNLLNTGNGHNYFVSFGTDINERKRYEAKVKQLAYYDTLTGLPNRAMLENEITRRLLQELDDIHFMIVFIDIDNFKTINDTMGHQVGDLFLTYLSKSLHLEIKEPDFVARLGGDEFAILYTGVTQAELLERIEVIKKRISKTWSIENRQFFISMSVGVAAYPEDGLNANLLLKNAEIAMYTAKREGKNRVLFYQEGINETNTQHMQMINHLQYGIEEDQFVLYYQPQFNLHTGEITGLEALVRWLHPELGFIPPSVFIPLAEDSGQIYKLERLIFHKALKQKQKLEEMGYNQVLMSINLSGKSLTSSINFEELERIIVHYSINFEQVVIEITETANISDVEIVIHHLHRLKKLGMKIALDDFGTGYSSLNYLKMFPINIIKLDKSFIDSINENGIDTLLIKNILALAHDLEFEVIAEGIETKEQLQFLREHLCEGGQGYLMSRPLSEEKIHQLLLNQYHFT